MAPRLSGQNCKFLKFLLSLNFQKRLEYKENNTKYRKCKVLITNTDDSQLCSISLYPTLYSITKQLNRVTNQSENKTNKYADKNPATTWFSIFVVGVCQQCQSKTASA